MCRIYKYRRGLTLIELLITVGLISILLTAVWSVYKVGFIAFYTQEVRAGVKGEMGRALVNISNELRRAVSVTAAGQTSLTFTIDTDNNGVNETIQYIWSGTAGDPLNKVTTSTAPAVNSVNSLAFSYYDANNNLLSFPVTASSVRLAAVDFTVLDKDETFRLRSYIKLRNI